MTEQKAYQVADWNGESGEYWAANQARLDALVAPPTADALASAELAVRSAAQQVFNISLIRHCGSAHP